MSVHLILSGDEASMAVRRAGEAHQDLQCGQTAEKRGSSARSDERVSGDDRLRGPVGPENRASDGGNQPGSIPKPNTL
ncbi:hypothetical protein [Dactylosporangium salmoneum]|uniref:hypothetical protein n=1 Tax=Dactylosporangium salmoneum TaxID=53361 RepID=UPI0031DC11F5